MEHVNLTLEGDIRSIIDMITGEWLWRWEWLSEWIVVVILVKYIDKYDVVLYDDNVNNINVHVVVVIF